MRLGLRRGLGVALSLSVGLNFFLFQKGRNYYLQLQVARLDPLGIEVHSNGASRKEKPLLVFFGDSRAAAWPAPLGLELFDTENRGVGSQTSAQVLGRYAIHVQPLAPRLVVLQVGINDLKTIALFPHRAERIVANCKSNIANIIQHSKRDGSEVILTTVFPLGAIPWERRPFWSDEVEVKLDELNQWIRSMHSDRVRVFDAWKILIGKQGKIDPNYSRDFLHLNDEGYRILNLELIKFL